MSGEQAAAIAIISIGASAFGAVLAVRRRRRRPAGAGPAGDLRPVKVVLSPGGDRAAAVLAGPPSESGFENLLETFLWNFLWLWPASLCRVEVWIVKAPDGRPDLAAPPEARRTVWKGAGGPGQAGEVAIEWAGPRKVRAAFRGVVHEIEAAGTDR
jgi:hypothetical protein